jgi:TusA-related sulfurtransferase
MPFAQTKQELSKLEVGQVPKVEADDQVEGIDLLERSIHMDLMDMSIREDTGRRKKRIRTVEAVPKVVAQASAFVSKFLG